MRLGWEFKRQIRHRTIFFWTGIFPLILAFLFSLVLKGVYSSNFGLNIEVAVIGGKENSTFLELMENAKIDDAYLFDIVECDEKEAMQLLDDQKVIGVIDLRDDISCQIAKNGYKETVLSEYIRGYMVNQKMVEDAYRAGLSLSEIQKMVMQSVDIEATSVTSQDPAAMHFFTIIGMVCMYGGFYGITTMRAFEGNLSSCGRRVLASSYSKAKLVLSNLLINNLILDVYVTIDILFIQYILKIDFGTSLTYILPLAYLGSFAGNGFGLIMGGIFPNGNPDIRENLLIGISMLFSFFSGMMSLTVKQLVHQFLPFLEYINPCYLISDGLYSLYYYGVGDRYYQHLQLLFIFGFVTTIISILMLRRRQYDAL